MANPLPEHPKQKEEAAAPAEVPSRDNGKPGREETARQAYQDWQQRGSPTGTPNEDWFRAEGELKQHKGETSTAKTAAPNPLDEGKKNAAPVPFVKRRYFKQVIGAILLVVVIAGAFVAWLIHREFPRLCRGGIQSLTNTGVHPRNSRREPPSTRKGESGWTSMRA